MGYKSWKKAIKALEIINKEKQKELIKKSNPKITNEELEKKPKNTNINHLWVDQLCINQKDNQEKADEVPKMRQYYDNSAITLISINTDLGEESNYLNILKKIINSEWFTRSWTFQEGWLSKHTIFMFDDRLVDGWAMAGTWALNQLGYANEGRYLSRREFEKGTKKIATPVGWVYYRDDYTDEDKVEMSLHQALKAIKNRGRGVPIDGIYSILGLLPYGEHVKVKYKNWGESYTKKDVEDVLYEVMKIAVKNGYGEPLAWHGDSNKNPGLCWMPQIVFNERLESEKWEELSLKEKEERQKNGSTSVEGGVDVDFHQIGNDKNIFKKGKGLQLHPDIYIIHKVDSHIQKLEEGFEIEGGLYGRGVEVKWEEYNEEKNRYESKIAEISLFGTERTMKLVQRDKYLAIFSKKQWTSKKTLALLVEDAGKKNKIKNHDKKKEVIDVYHRLGLVELGNEERLKGNWKTEKQIIIGSSPQEQLQSQIQTPPK